MPTICADVAEWGGHGEEDMMLFNIHLRQRIVALRSTGVRAFKGLSNLPSLIYMLHTSKRSFFPSYMYKCSILYKLHRSAPT